MHKQNIIYSVNLCRKCDRVILKTYLFLHLDYLTVNHILLRVFSFIENILL